MHFKALEVGRVVVVIDFDGSDYDRPEHWSPDMDEWQGAVVTISDFDDEYVYIEEDEGAWSWHAADFEPYCNLKYGNPNVVYKRHKSNLRFEKMRTEWQTKNDKEKVKKAP